MKGIRGYECSEVEERSREEVGEIEFVELGK